MAKGVPLMGRDPDDKAKIINVDENGNVKVQLSGTYAQVGKDVLQLHSILGAVPAGGSKRVEVDLDELGFPAEYFSLAVRNPDGGDNPYRVTVGYRTHGNPAYFNFGSGLVEIIPTTTATILITDRFPLLSKGFRVIVDNEGDTDFSFGGFTLYLWSTSGEKISDISIPPPALYGATVDQRPSAGSVEVGTTFTLTNSNLDTWISDGTAWVEV